MMLIRKSGAGTIKIQDGWRADVSWSSLLVLLSLPPATLRPKAWPTAYVGERMAAVLRTVMAACCAAAMSVTVQLA